MAHTQKSLVRVVSLFLETHRDRKRKRRPFLLENEWPAELSLDVNFSTVYFFYIIFSPLFEFFLMIAGENGAERSSSTVKSCLHRKYLFDTRVTAYLRLISNQDPRVYVKAFAVRLL